MKRIARCCSVLAALSLVANSASAQTAVVGVGADFAANDYSTADSAKTGYQFMAGLEYPFLSKMTSLRFDGLLGWQARTTNFRETNYLAGVNARIVLWAPKISSLHPYALGGIGYLYNKYNPGQSISRPSSVGEVTYGVGVGTELMLGPVSAFVEGRYDYGATLTRIYPLVVGMRFHSSQ